MPTEYLDRATAISVGQIWSSADLLAALREMRYDRTTAAEPGRGEFRWSTATSDGGVRAGPLLSVNLVHEDRILEVGMQRLADDGGLAEDGESEGLELVGGLAEDGEGEGPELVVRELRYRDVGSRRGIEASAAVGAEALIEAVLHAEDSELPALTRAEVGALKVAELRAACAERALSTDGLKPLLAARLSEHEAQRRGSSPDGSSKLRAAADVADVAAGAGERPAHVVLYPASHYTVGQEEQKARVLDDIAAECASAVDALLSNGQVAEAERLRYRTESDIAEIAREGYCSGMENYSRVAGSRPPPGPLAHAVPRCYLAALLLPTLRSAVRHLHPAPPPRRRHLTGRKPGEPPPTLVDYMPDDWLMIVDESHISVPQLGAMYSGDRSRKSKLVAGGFRLPSALDNRPLTGDEVWQKVPQAVLVSATPGAELAMCGRSPFVTEMVVRPTGIADPQVSVVDVGPLGGYEDHLLAQIERRIAKREATLVTCITKSSAEALSAFLTGHGIASLALHSGVQPLERLRILDDLRGGKLNVLVGCNLLREGLDLPQVSLVCVLNADKQGLLRSATSLIQTIGRAARHVDGTALLYTESGRTSDAMREAIRETDRRRERQLAHNKLHAVVPRAAGTAPRGEASAEGASTRESQPASNGGGSVLTMLSRGKPGGSKAEDRGPPGGELEGEDRELYDELRAWRGQVARAGGRRRRPFMILTEAVMQALALARPSNMAELLDVKGVGPKKADMYGEAILQIVRSNDGPWIVNGQQFELP